MQMTVSEYLRRKINAEVAHHEKRLERMRMNKDKVRIYGRIEGLRAAADMLDRWTEIYGEEAWSPYDRDPYVDGLLEEEHEY